jgi:membrane-associated protease RseP (regulator of RpoE activity)
MKRLKTAKAAAAAGAAKAAKPAFKALELGLRGETAIALVALASIALFSAVATSGLQNYIKAPVLIAELVVTGLAIQRITGAEGYAGIVMIRAKRGFTFMNKLAEKIASPAKLACEAGLVIGFGFLYALYAFRKNRVKVLAYSIATLALFLFITGGAGPAVVEIIAISFLFGLVGLGVFSLATHAINILTIPGTAPGVLPVIPGLTPGIPLVEGIIALIIIVVVHEGAHGVLCRIEGLRLKSDGLLFFGFLPIGAFIEPDEQKLRALPVEKKRRILSAGSTSNLVFFLVFVALSFAAAVSYAATVESVAIRQVLNATPAEGVLFGGDVVLAADGHAVKNSGELGQVLRTKSEGDAVKLSVRRNTAEGPVIRDFTIVLGAGGKLGIAAQDIARKGLDAASDALTFVYRTFYLTYTLNFALALVNMLPLFITDGHRIIEDELSATLGRKRRKLAKRIAAAFGIICVALILVNIVPWFT